MGLCCEQEVETPNWKVQMMEKIAMPPQKLVLQVRLVPCSDFVFGQSRKNN